MKLHVLVEDESSNPNLQSIHGVSFFIELENGYTILFDTAQKDIFLKNAKKLSLDVINSDICVISHNHYDHAGGLSHFLTSGYSNPVYLHHYFFKNKFSIKNGKKVSSIGFSKELSIGFKNINFVINDLTQVHENVYILANVPFSNSFEEINKNFLIEEGSKCNNDLFDDEISLLIRTNKGIVVISGCSHRGIINILNKTRSLFSDEVLYAFIGGTHLLDASDFRLEKTKEELLKFNLKTLAACHCTGQRGIKFFAENFQNAFIRIKTGSVLNL